MICKQSDRCFSQVSGFSLIFCGSGHTRFLTRVYLRGHLSSSFVTAVTRNFLVYILTMRASRWETFFSFNSESSLSATNPILIREASFWFTCSLKSSEKSFSGVFILLSVSSVTNLWRRCFSVVKRSSSRKGSMGWSVWYFIRKGVHSCAMERKMLTFTKKHGVRVFLFNIVKRPVFWTWHFRGLNISQICLDLCHIVMALSRTVTFSSHLCLTVLERENS